MQAFNYLKMIYSGKNAIKRHITLFSIIGIVVLMLNNVLSDIGNNIMFTLITSADISDTEMILDFFFGACLLILIFGYEYVFIHQAMAKNEISLPELDSDSYSAFFKMLPIFILWQFYYTVVTVIGGIILAILKNPTCSYLFSAIMLCLTPFVFMVFIKFAYNFKYSREIFFPWTIFKYMNKSLMQVMIFFLQFCLIAALPVFALIGFGDWAFAIKNPTHKLVASLLWLCTVSYTFVIFKYVFSLGLTKIVKEKFLQND